MRRPLPGGPFPRCFVFQVVDGTIAAYLAAPHPNPDGDAELWHVRHDDGDEEDLERHEVLAARRCSAECTFLALRLRAFRDARLRGLV